MHCQGQLKPPVTAMGTGAMLRFRPLQYHQSMPPGTA